MKVKNKHAKRVIRDLKALGCKINYISADRGWHNKKVYEISVIFKDHELICCGYNELNVCKYTRKLIQWELADGTITRGRLWHSKDFKEAKINV